MTERLHVHFSFSCIGEGNGNPLQCSCLENPRDGGAWWTAIYGVAQSQTRLKRLSSSSDVYVLPFYYLFFGCFCSSSLSSFSYLCFFSCHLMIFFSSMHAFLSFNLHQLPPISRISHVRLCATPQTAAYQASLSLGFSRQEYWSEFPFPSPVHENEK